MQEKACIFLFIGWDFQYFYEECLVNPLKRAIFAVLFAN